MKSYEELFKNQYFPNIKVMNFDEILVKNDNIEANFAEKLQISSEKTSNSVVLCENKDYFPTTILKNVTPKRSLLARLRGE